MTFGVTSKVGHLDQPYASLLYILHLAKILFDFIFYSIYGLLAGPIHSILILILMVSFVDGSP